MSTVSVITGRSLARVSTPSTSNRMASVPESALASTIAWRNDPAPASSRFKTMKVAGTVRPSSCSRTKPRLFFLPKFITKPPNHSFYLFLPEYMVPQKLSATNHAPNFLIFSCNSDTNFSNQAIRQSGNQVIRHQKHTWRSRANILTLMPPMACNFTNRVDLEKKRSSSFTCNQHPATTHIFLCATALV